MLFLSIYSTSLICSSIFFFMKHPMAMGLMLLIQTIIISMMTGIMMKTFWFSYVLFLVFVGGMLVLFIYVTSLASNEMFNISMKMISISFSLLLTMNFFLFFMDKSFNLFLFESFDSMNLDLMKSFYQENLLTMNKLYNFPINLITIILMVYLFLTLVAVVKITNIFEGPLRPKNN